VEKKALLKIVKRLEWQAANKETADKSEYQKAQKH
jgi:hypothetical protein